MVIRGHSGSSSRPRGPGAVCWLAHAPSLSFRGRSLSQVRRLGYPPCWKCHGTTLPPGPRFQHYVLDSEGNLWTTVCCGCDLAEGLEFVLEHYRTVQEVRLAVATELRRYWARRREVPPPPPGPIPAAGPKPPPPPPPRSIWAQGLAAGSRLQTRSPPAVRPFVPQDPSGLAEHGW